MPSLPGLASPKPTTPAKWPRDPWGATVNIIFVFTLVISPFALFMSAFLFDTPGSEHLFLSNYILYGVLAYPLLVLIWWPFSRKFHLVFGIVPLVLWLLTWGWAAMLLIGFAITSPFIVGWQATTFQPRHFNDPDHFMCADGSYLVQEGDGQGGMDIVQYGNSFSDSSVGIIADKSFDQPNHDQLSLDGSIASAYFHQKYLPMIEQCKNSEGKNIFEVYGVIIPPDKAVN